MKKLRLAWNQYNGPALALVGLVLSLGIFWYQEFGKKGEVTLAILHQGSVLTIQRVVPDLEVRFRGSTLPGNDKSLRYYNIEVRNTGSVHIAKSAFDDPPWEIQMDGGEIVQITNVVYKHEPLKNVDPRVVDGAKFRLSAANVDVGDWIRIDFLAFVDGEREPTFKLVGRISGTELLFRPYEPVDTGTFSGGLATQLARLIGYGLVVLFATGLVAFLLGRQNAWRRSSATKHRHAEKRRLEKLPSTIDVGLQHSIVEFFGAWGWEGVNILRSYLGNPDFRKRCVGLASQFMSAKEVLPGLDVGLLRDTVFSQLSPGTASDVDRVAMRVAANIIIDNNGLEDGNTIRGAFEFIDKMHDEKVGDLP